MADQDLEIRIKAKNLTAEEYTKVKEFLANVKKDAADASAAGQGAFGNFKKSIDDLIPSTASAKATFTDLKASLSDTFDNPTSSAKRLGGALASDLAAGAGTAGVALAGAAAAAVVVGAAAF